MRAFHTHLKDALLRRPELPTVLHLSAHIALNPPQKPQLLLEDHRAVAHALSEDALSAMASWEAEPYVAGCSSWLFVFLACGSEQMVLHLQLSSTFISFHQPRIQTAGLHHAICCRGEVLDASARVFCRVAWCLYIPYIYVYVYIYNRLGVFKDFKVLLKTLKAFYKALAAGRSVCESHSLAQSAVRHSASLGIQKEAEKFLYLQKDVDNDVEKILEKNEISAQCLRRASPWSPWPSWPRVEDGSG